jgi:hypothetical protein
MKKFVSFASLSLALLLSLTSPASADLLATGTREAFNSDISTAAGVYTTLALNDAGSTSLGFTAAASGPVQIVYSAECAVTTAGTIVVLQILVDGTAIGPGAGTVWRFCSGTVLENKTRVVAPSVSAGAHTLTIIASGVAQIRHSVTTVSK